MFALQSPRLVQRLRHGWCWTASRHKGSHKCARKERIAMSRPSTGMFNKNVKWWTPWHWRIYVNGFVRWQWPWRGARNRSTCSRTNAIRLGEMTISHRNPHDRWSRAMCLHLASIWCVPCTGNGKSNGVNQWACWWTGHTVPSDLTYLLVAQWMHNKRHRKYGNAWSQSALSLPV